MSALVGQQSSDDFDEVSKELRANAERLNAFAKGYAGTVEKLIDFLSKVREVNHFEESIYETMVEKRRQIGEETLD